MAQNSKKKYKIAVLALAPFHYHAQLYRELSDSSEIDLYVYYCSDLKREFLAVDEKESLRGYNFEFLKNYAPVAGALGKWFGAMNFGISGRIIKNQYDLVIFQHWDKVTSWLAILTCLRLRIPFAFMTDTNCLADGLKPAWKLVFKKFILQNFIFKNATGFLASGIANEEFYKKYGVPLQKIVKFHYSFGYDWFVERAAGLGSQRKEIREKNGIKDDDFVILFVGRLVEEKDIFTLLSAYEKVKHQNKKLFLIGDGPLRLDLETCVKNLGIEGVFFLGSQSRESVIDFYAAADVLVLPSVNETWGIVVNEAMCLGLPVIVSDKVGAVADMVRDGYNGFVFPSGNSEQLSFCIEKMASMEPEDRAVFGAKSFEIISRWIDDMNPADQILKIVELSKKNGGRK